MNGKRVCIITPGQLGSNPRVVKEAETLAAAGLDVRVVATKVANFVEPRDKAVLALAQYRVDRIAFDRPAQWRRARLAQIATRFACHLRPFASLAGSAHSAMTPQLTTAACDAPADLFIAHYVAALPAAARAACFYQARFAFDAEDFHVGDLPDEPRHTFDKRLIQVIEERCLAKASYVTAASPGIATGYEQTYGIELPHVVLNAFPKRDALPNPTPRGNAHPWPTLYWFSQTIGPGRGLECATHAIARARTAPHFHVRGTPAAGFDAKLRDIAKAAGAEHRLHFHPPAAPSDMVRLAGEYDAGLVAETGATRSREIALTNKQFAYLLAGVPAIMSDVPAHIEFAKKAAGAVFLYKREDPDALATALDFLFERPDRLSDARARAFSLGQTTYNWEIEAPKLLAIVAKALSGLA